jgi:hypothetical protein
MKRWWRRKENKFQSAMWLAVVVLIVIFSHTVWRLISA